MIVASQSTEVAHHNLKLSLPNKFQMIIYESIIFWPNGSAILWIEKRASFF